jgi:hypothetical protein
MDATENIFVYADLQYVTSEKSLRRSISRLIFGVDRGCVHLFQLHFVRHTPYIYKYSLLSTPQLPYLCEVPYPRTPSPKPLRLRLFCL